MNKHNILLEFENNLTSNMKDIDPDFSITVDKHFWDLIDKEIDMSDKKECTHSEIKTKIVNGETIFVCNKCGKVVNKQKMFAEQNIPTGHILHG